MQCQVQPPEVQRPGGGQTVGLEAGPLASSTSHGRRGGLLNERGPKSSRHMQQADVSGSPPEQSKR